MPDRADARLEMTNSVSGEIDGAPDRVWTVLTETSTPNAVFMGARAVLGEAGEPFRLARDDGWLITGVVLVKQPPGRLRLSWKIKTPATVSMPNVEVEFVIARLEGGEGSRLTITEYADGPIPAPYTDAGRAGWAMMLRRAAASFGESSR